MEGQQFLASDEMRNLQLFKYFSTAVKTAVKTAPKEVKEGKENKEVKETKAPKVAEKPFTYDFTEDLKKVNHSFETVRLNPGTKYSVPKELLTKPKNQYLIGNTEKISNVLIDHEEYIGKVGTVSGWAKTTRAAGKDLFFIELNDGTCQKNLQIVVNAGSVPNYAEVVKTGTATSFKITGLFVEAQGGKQKIEMIINSDQHKVEILGPIDPKHSKDYPMAKKFHTVEKLREIAHLRPRSNLIGCVARIRNNLAYATHIYFQSNGFQYIHTPCLTASDCEGAGEMFQVTTMLPKPEESLNKVKIPTQKDGKIDYSKDFFKKPTFLTVSGQLSVENYCCSLSNVYTFGPTFRAEVSHTTRHLAEFWMIEPEIAFADVHDVIDCAEGYVKFCLEYVLQNNRMDLEFLQDAVKPDLIAYLTGLISGPFARLSYTDAITLLQKAVSEGKVFENRVHWGEELATEHERFLAEVVFKKPVAVYNYPKDFKAFYMRLNEDGKTVAAFDMLAPQVGELIGGSQREERLDVLEKRLTDIGLNPADYWWYLDLRRYGTIPHGGFGLGFERLCMLASGVENVRDVIPFPRTHGNAEF